MGLNTITEYQLLHLARAELLRRLDRLKTKMIKSEDGELSKKDNVLFDMYSEQVTEINQRMAAISKWREDRYRIQVWTEGQWRWGLHDYTKEQAEARLVELRHAGIKCQMRPSRELFE